MQVYVSLGSSVGTTLTVHWKYVSCAGQYAVISGNDTVACEPCPSGAVCDPTLHAASTVLDDNSSVSVAVGGTVVRQSVLHDVVVQQSIVAGRGWWASDSSAGLTYYPCAIVDACLGGVNDSRATCGQGYTGTVVCGDVVHVRLVACDVGDARVCVCDVRGTRARM